MKSQKLINARTIRIGKYTLLSFFGMIASLIFLYPQVFYCEMIGFSGFTASSNRIYFSPELRAGNIPQLKRVIFQSETRVDSFYQGKKSQPKIIVCTNQQQYQRYCSSTEGAGCSVGTPWGSSFVILNAQGLTVDVVAHEMSHVELLDRLGWWTVTMDVPQWFNEGLALMLDRRFVPSTEPGRRYLEYMDEWLYYTGGGQQILELRDIHSIKGFYNGDQRHVMLAYMSSGMEVSYWLAMSGRNAVSGLIEDISSGQTFDAAYELAEKAGRSKTTGKLPLNPLRLNETGKMVK